MAYGTSALRVFIAGAERRGDGAEVTRLKKLFVKAEERECRRAAELGMIAASQEVFERRFGRRY